MKRVSAKNFMAYATLQENITGSESYKNQSVLVHPSNARAHKSVKLMNLGCCDAQSG